MPHTAVAVEMWKKRDIFCMLVAAVYLSVLDLVFEGLLEEIEGILLSVGLHHHIPGLLHLNLHRARKKQSDMQTFG